MDVSGKEFTLNFHGFEQDDPETVKRFTAFCEANFALSPDTFGDANDLADTVVLTHGESHEALEALAKVLREIGARVDVSEGCRFEGSDILDGPSPQELHRLFGHRNDDGSSSTDGPSCPYPPLGRTLYLLTQSDGVFDRRRLRPKTYRSEARREEARQEAATRISRRNHALVVVSAISLCVGIVALIAATVLVKRSPLSLDSRERHSLFQSREVSEIPKSDGALEAIPSARTLSANKRGKGFTIDVKVLASSRSLSISSLTLTPNDRFETQDRSVIKKVVGDPTFLTEFSPGEWKGRVQLSVFVEKEGRESHVTIPALVSVKVSEDNTVGRAVIEVANEALKNSSEYTVALGSQASSRLLTFAISDLTLS